jgi:hypothetical protein
LNRTNPKWAFLTRVKEGSQPTLIQTLKQKKILKMRKKCRKRLDEHNPFMESIKVFFKKIKKYTYIYVRIRMGL